MKLEHLQILQHLRDPSAAKACRAPLNLLICVRRMGDSGVTLRRTVSRVTPLQSVGEEPS
jgi:hypothetical protein